VIGVQLIKLIYFVGLVFLLIGCNTSESRRILKLDLQIQNGITPAILDVKLIRLENGDESIIGEIMKVDCFNNNFYVHDLLQSRTLFVFDSAGSFINKTRRGRGPGEVIFPWGFNFDKDSSMVMLWDSDTRTMQYFTPNLESLYSYSNEDVILWDFEKYKDGNLLTYTHFADINRKDKNRKYFNYFLRNSKGEVIKEYLPIENEKLTHYILISPIWRTEWNTYLISPFDFTIYSYKNEEIKPYMYIDFGSVGLEYEQLRKSDFDYMEFVDKGSLVIAMDYLINNEQFIAFSFYLNHDQKFVIYSKQMDEIYYSDILFTNGILPKCKLHSFREGRFIGVVNPLDYIDNLNKFNCTGHDLKYPNESDNPYIITFRIEE